MYFWAKTVRDAQGRQLRREGFSLSASDGERPLANRMGEGSRVRAVPRRMRCLRESGERAQGEGAVSTLLNGCLDYQHSLAPLQSPGRQPPRPGDRKAFGVLSWPSAKTLPALFPVQTTVRGPDMSGDNTYFWAKTTEAGLRLATNSVMRHHSDK
jgi:hypothetical protein